MQEKMYKGKLGIALISFDRPHYFSKTIKSLEEQTHLEKTDFHLFQDGRINKFSYRFMGKKININKSIDLFREANLPNKSEHIRKRNYGNGIQQFEAVEYMSERYEYFMVIEDDVVLSPYYFRLIRIMIDQFFGLEDVFSLSLSFRRKCPKEEIPENLNKLGYMKEHWWAECWSSYKWKNTRKYFLDYYRFIQNCKYQKRPHTKIREFFKEEGFDKVQTSQDAGKDYMLYKSGMKRINSVVNRGFYIGEKGLHFRKEAYEEYGFADMKPYTHQTDETISEFDLQ